MRERPSPGALPVRPEGDHPRACGKDRLSFLTAPSVGGSPPRMRERQIIIIKRQVRPGITPAHAGKTAIRRTYSILAQEHPRACGKDLRDKMGHPPHPGSPPRMRERRRISRRSYCQEGITPAHAGKTWSRLPTGSRRRDHPRACGKDARDHLAAFRDYRITPAHAGKTRCTWSLHSRHGDHPRACGKDPMPAQQTSL